MDPLIAYGYNPQHRQQDTKSKEEVVIEMTSTVNVESAPPVQRCKENSRANTVDENVDGRGGIKVLNLI